MIWEYLVIAFRMMFAIDIAVECLNWTNIPISFGYLCPDAFNCYTFISFCSNPANKKHNGRRRGGRTHKNKINAWNCWWTWVITDNRYIEMDWFRETRAPRENIQPGERGPGEKDARRVSCLIIVKIPYCKTWWRPMGAERCNYLKFNSQPTNIYKYHNAIGLAAGKERHNIWYLRNKLTANV